MTLPYFPMYPRDFHEGTLELSLELKGAYVMVLFLMYTRGGPITDEPKYISNYIGCSVRKWKQVRETLIEMGKLVVEGGVIRNSRADEELEKLRSYQRKQAENGGQSNKNKAQQQPSKPRQKTDTETEDCSVCPPSNQNPDRQDIDPSEVDPAVVAVWRRCIDAIPPRLRGTQTTLKLFVKVYPAWKAKQYSDTTILRAVEVVVGQQETRPTGIVQSWNLITLAMADLAAKHDVAERKAALMPHNTTKQIVDGKLVEKAA